MTRARDVANLIGSGNFSSTTFTATAGQTAFTISHTQGFIQVFMNGLLLDETVDYTSNGSAVTLTSGAAAGDEIEVVAYNTFSVGDAVPASGGTFTGAVTHTGAFTSQGIDDNANATAITIDSSENVGIGLSSSIDRKLHVEVDNDFAVKFGGTAAGDFAIEIGQDGNNGSPAFNATAGSMKFKMAGTEAMRIDTSGNLLVGHTSAYSPIQDGGSGVSAMQNGQLFCGMAGAAPFLANLEDSSGDIAIFRKDGSKVGGIGCTSVDVYIAGNRGAGIKFTDQELFPVNASGSTRDNAIDLGHSASRFDDIYATNSSIQTSDENEKQNIASLTSAEITAATAISKLFKTYKWKDKVAAKGDNARTHTGVIAQQVQSAMSDAGLDASKYAFWCSDTWWETQTEVAAVEADEEKGIEAQDAYTRTDTYDTKEEAPEGATEHTRLGVRYPELLAFIGAATEQRLTSIEARLSALEGK